MLRVATVLQKNFKHLKNTHTENMSMPCGLWKKYLELQHIQRDFNVINLNCYIYIRPCSSDNLNVVLVHLRGYSWGSIGCHVQWL